MKKASKIVGLLLSLAMAMIMLVGCPTGDEDDDPVIPQPGLTAEWQTFYLKLSDFGLDTAVNRIHFHGEYGGIEIQKVFVSQTKSEDGATVILDFTRNDGPNGTYPYLMYSGGYDYNADLNGFVEDGGTATGRYSYEFSSDTEPGSYVYGGSFGSGAAYDTDAVYYGFVARNVSATKKGDRIRLGLKPATDEVVKEFWEWMGYPEPAN